MIDLWYKEAVIYELDVKTYQDSNDDGIGDFHGLIQRLPHIAGLGVTCLWLRPFYPSPWRDDGYDVAEYYNVDPRIGTLGDFVEFMRRAKERGIRVLVDLVINHTSDQHAWFQTARQDPRSPYRDYYLWSKDEPQDKTTGIVFPGTQDSVWTYDEQAQAWYHHQFYCHQPDLNLANPKVRREIRQIMGFWLELGVSGFRLDAASFLIEPSSDPNEAFAYLEEFRSFLSWRKAGSIMLAEANVPLEEAVDYFDEPRIPMMFNFLLNQHLFLALARHDATPLVDMLKRHPPLPTRAQWANFLRNHDELDLSRLDADERREVFAAFAPKKHMRAYERGIRRRLSPMLEGDRQRLEFAFSLLFSLPGTPVIPYGDEIGMGDALALSERLSVRTPMQWSAETNAGFSEAPAAELLRPVITRGAFGYRQRNVADQQREAGSFLNWMERLIRVRKECPEIGWGSVSVLDADETGIAMHRCTWEGGAVLLIHNFAAREARVMLPIEGSKNMHPMQIMGDQPYEELPQARELRMRGYGYLWLRLCGRGMKQV